MATNAKNTTADAKPCPTCGAPSMHETRPFCSKRCADIDLGRWFQGAYAIPAVDAADDSLLTPNWRHLTKCVSQNQVEVTAD